MGQGRRLCLHCMGKSRHNRVNVFCGHALEDSAHRGDSIQQFQEPIPHQHSIHDGAEIVPAPPQVDIAGLRSDQFDEPPLQNHIIWIARLYGIRRGFIIDYMSQGFGKLLCEIGRYQAFLLQHNDLGLIGFDHVVIHAMYLYGLRCRAKDYAPDQESTADPMSR